MGGSLKIPAKKYTATKEEVGDETRRALHLRCVERLVTGGGGGAGVQIEIRISHNEVGHALKAIYCAPHSPSPIRSVTLIAKTVVYASP